jgi:hypothetical protein
MVLAAAIRPMFLYQLVLCLIFCLQGCLTIGAEWEQRTPPVVVEVFFYASPLISIWYQQGPVSGRTDLPQVKVPYRNSSEPARASLDVNGGLRQ